MFYSLKFYLVLSDTFICPQDYFLIKMAHCGECKLDFCKTSNLRAHVKRKHPDKLDLIAPLRKQSGSGEYACKECNKSFSSFSNLRFHVKQKHNDNLEKLAPIKKKNFKCNQCDCKFDGLRQIVCHKSTHKIKTIQCSLCQYTGPSTNILVQHYKQEHCLEVINETLEFNSVKAFQAWKSSIEAETFASFVQKTGAKKALKHIRTIYSCHRSGHFNPRGNNIRKPKIQGSNKIGGYCPAKMTVLTEDDKCSVQFCKTHVGHGQERDLGHLFLTKSERENIAAKIAELNKGGGPHSTAKVLLQAILDEIRDSVQKHGLGRIQLLTKKDLHNIENSFNLKGSSIHHVNDAISVKACDNELKAAQVQEVKERRNKLLRLIQEELLHVTSLEEMEAAEKVLAPLKPTLAAVRTKQANFHHLQVRHPTKILIPKPKIK